jgi:hypothetical protein
MPGNNGSGRSNMCARLAKAGPMVNVENCRKLFVAP